MCKRTGGSRIEGHGSNQIRGDGFPRPVRAMQTEEESVGKTQKRKHNHVKTHARFMCTTRLKALDFASLYELGNFGMASHEKFNIFVLYVFLYILQYPIQILD